MASASPELQVGVRPQRGQEEQVDQHEQQCTLRVVVLVHDPLPGPTGPVSDGSPRATPAPGRAPAPSISVHTDGKSSASCGGGAPGGRLWAVRAARGAPAGP